LCNQYGANFYPIAMPTFLTGWLGEISTAQQHAGWRYTLMSGLIPAIPLILIRPFLPESPAWAEKKRSGTLKRPSIVELFTTPQLRKTTIVTTIMFACCYGAAFGAIQQIRQIVPGLEVVQEETRGLPPPQQARHISSVAAEYTMLQEAGGLTGRFLLALLVVRIASRQRLIRLFQIPGLIITPLVFYFFLTMDNTPFFVIDLEGIYLHKMPFTPLTIGIFFVGLFTVAQFSFWGNYLPHVYPLHLRGTGESFAANIGGRMIGTMFAAVSVGLSTLMPRDTYPEQLAMAAALVGLTVYTVGVICSFFLPEPKSEALPD
jgi:hypothetical protein